MNIIEAIPTPTFANHESFHLRYGWLKKAYDQVQKDSHIFTRDDATIKLGVGKNMVRAIRFWGLTNKIIEIEKGVKKPGMVPTSIGKIIFDENKGLDPYLEKSNTLWLLHWLLYVTPCRVPVWWITMNEFSATNLKIDDLTESVIKRITNIAEWNTPNSKSIKKDIDVFLHTYSTRQGKLSIEDYLDCPFRHLHMIKQNSRDVMRFVLGTKPGITPLIIAFACMDFIHKSTISSKSVSLSRLTTEAGGVGNIFKLNENDLIDLLQEASYLTDVISLQNINGSQHLVFDSAKDTSIEILKLAYGKIKIPPKHKIGLMH